MYVELHLHTNYSFQEGASSIAELVTTAKDLGYSALAITDHDNLCGAMEFALACRDIGLQPIIGCEMTMVGGHHLTLLSENRQGYGNLCWLLSQAYRRDRLSPALDPTLFEGYTSGLIALSGCRQSEVAMLLDEDNLIGALLVAKRYRDLFGWENYYLELQQHLVKGDTVRNRRLTTLAQELRIGTVATGNVHYHVRERSHLQDCLVAMKALKSLKDSHRQRRANSEFYLKPQQEIATLFKEYPEALAHTTAIAQRCAAFDLTKNLNYRFPDYPVPGGHTALTYLAQLCVDAATRRYGDMTPEVSARLDEELRLVGKHNLAGFFLLYRDIILMAHEVAADLDITDRETPVEINPPGRGRGSSVSMLIGYLLGLSHIDPLQYRLSLERFLPEDALASVPDIDLDFPRNIREELILRVHQRYGWEKAALTGMIETYRIRGCVRDLGKALGLPDDQIDQLAKRVDDAGANTLEQQMLLLPAFASKVVEPLWRHLIDLSTQLDGFPRQLAQHPGGMVISSTPLTEIVPVQPSAMDGRYIIHWDKDSIDQAGFVKIDFLALGALSQMQDAVKAIHQRHGETVDLSRIDFEDKAVYAMLHAADTIGIFQVESAAQMQTIPRIKPMNLTDMAHEVGAVRPGVGANDGVRHYILRRTGMEEKTFDHELERRALDRTYGVILFQDQVNQVAIDVGGLSPSDADRMRRAFSKRNNEELIRRWWDHFLEGATKNGVDYETAERIFRKFNGHYMFPESHAFAFGVTAYQMAWLKRYHPVEFYLGLFNQQPMGFYTPETLKEDAKRHQVPVLNPDVNRSEALCVSEGDAIRLGFLYVKGIGEETAAAVVTVRNRGTIFLTLADFMERSGLVQQQVEDLIDAGGLDTLSPDRRRARWEVGLRYRPINQQMGFAMPVAGNLADLPQAGAVAEMRAEYRTMGLHPKSHAMAYARASLGAKVLTSEQVLLLPDGAEVTMAGLIIRRQRPLAKVVFITIEDEFGHAPLMVFPKIYAKLRNVLKAPFVIVDGTVTRRENTMNIVITGARVLQVLDTPPPSKDFR